MELARWSPWPGALGLELERFFEPILGIRAPGAGRAGFVPALEAVEDEKALTLRLEVPGAKREELAVEVEEGVLRLKGRKEEVREELKHLEGDPVMKRRRREVQMKLAAQRIQRDVPRADVVVTNPTHLAIALKYEPQEMAAPKVVAKGADGMAYRIRQVAAVHGVPLVERPELVRMMYEVVEVGQEIPERFYEAVAEVLAYVYELSGRKLGPQPVPVA